MDEKERKDKPLWRDVIEGAIVLFSCILAAALIIGDSLLMLTWAS